jgi:hypothetical protein
MRDQEERLRYYEHLCRKAEKNTSDKPMSCGKCPCHREDFRYRTCVFTRCPYGLSVDVFRKRPLKREKITKGG